MCDRPQSSYTHMSYISRERPAGTAIWVNRHDQLTRLLNTRKKWRRSERRAHPPA